MRKFLALMLFVLCQTGAAFAAVPSVIHYEGYLTDVDGAPVSGDYTISFKFFAQQSGGTAAFTEIRDTKVDLGVFSAILGLKPDNPLNPELFAATELWLELAVGLKGSSAVTLAPRQRVVSHPYALRSLSADQCKVADNALSFGGVAPQAYVTVAGLPQLCVTDSEFPDKLTQLGIAPYGDTNVGAYLTANGYKPGGVSSVSWADVQGKPVGLLTESAAVDSGVFLLSDGSVVASGDLDMGGNSIINFVVENASSKNPPADPQAGQLWFDTDENVLKIYGKTGGWAALGSANALDCEGCVDSGDVAFTYAGAGTKGGAAAVAENLTCVGCVEANELSAFWAMGTAPGGPAAGLQCNGCVTVGALDPTVLTAANVKYDDSVTAIGGNNVADIARLMDVRLDALEAKPTDFTEGNGTVVAFDGDWVVDANGSVKKYLHMFNPTLAKVLVYLRSGDPLMKPVTADYSATTTVTLNSYAAITSTVAVGGTMVNVDSSTGFSAGDLIMLYQTVKSTTTPAGTWETNRVKTVVGNTLVLYFPVKYRYDVLGLATGKAQVVKAASYRTFTVENGGVITASAFPGTEEKGGIVFIKATSITVRNGGIIHADFAGYEGADNYNYTGANGTYSERGHSECSTEENIYQKTNNCSGGGGVYNYSTTSPYYPKAGAGGGGNKTAGGNGTAATAGNNGTGGTAKGAANLNTLNFGGAGGCAYGTVGGNGGGIVLLAADTVSIEAGGVVRANGQAGGSNVSSPYSGSGGGAGGTVAVVAKAYTNAGTVQALGGALGDGYSNYDGGVGGDGWVVTAATHTELQDRTLPSKVKIYVDGADVTSKVGDPNQKGSPAWNSTAAAWGDGYNAWETGELDLSSVADWSLGEHNIELVETGGVGGRLILSAYAIYRFTDSVPVSNDTCATAKTFDPMLATGTIRGTTEDTMGKTKATDDYLQPSCGGSGGPDVVYKAVLTNWRKLKFDVVSPFEPRIYVRKGDCLTGSLVACGGRSVETPDLKTGTYYVFVDGDGNLQKGNFIMNYTSSVPLPPANDTCTAPQTLAFVNKKAEVYGVTLFATNQYVGPGVCGGTGANDLAYKFTVPAGTTNVLINLDADFPFAYYVSNSACTGTYAFCVNQANYTMNSPSSGDWWIIIDGKAATDKGEFTLTLTLE